MKLKFSEATEFFLKFLIDKFDKFIKKDVSKNNDDTYKIIFDDMSISYNYIKYLKRNNKIKRRLLTSDKFNSSEMILSSFVPIKIRNLIKNNTWQNLQYEAELMNQNKIQINFMFYNSNEDLSKYDLYSNLMLTWLKMAFLHSSVNCSKKLKIFLYMTEEKKYLPENQVEILSPIHCNSAVTTGCLSKTEIIIFRKEEWFKVFIHETFHCLGLDFANYSTKEFRQGIKNIFPLKDISITESYAEFWATILNCLFCSFNLLERKSDFEKFMLYNCFFIQFEQIFSILQMVKILNFMGISYKSLYQKDAISVSVRKYLYKEKTNVFAYYILKSILLFFYDDFIEWCVKNNISLLRFNRDAKTLSSLLNFIQQKHDNQDFIDLLKEMGSFIKEIKQSEMTEDTKELLITARMTVCELVKN